MILILMNKYKFMFVISIYCGLNVDNGDQFEHFPVPTLFVYICAIILCNSIFDPGILDER